jgi:hypothetical protein
MRYDLKTDAEGLSFQQGLGAALSGAGQGAAAGTSVYPGWGTLFGALAGAGLSVAQAATAPTPQAAAPTPQPRPAAPRPPAQPSRPPNLPAAWSAPLIAPAPAVPAASPPAAPPTPAASPAPASAGLGTGVAPFDPSDLVALLQNPKAQDFLRSLIAGQTSEPAASGRAAPGHTTGFGEAESVDQGNAANWLLANGVARLR